MARNKNVGISVCQILNFEINYKKSFNLSLLCHNDFSFLVTDKCLHDYYNIYCRCGPAQFTIPKVHLFPIIILLLYHSRRMCSIDAKVKQIPK